MKLTKEQVNMLKSNIDKMGKSDEQFIFILFKNLDGTNNITEHSHNIIPEQLVYYFQKAIRRGVKK